MAEKRHPLAALVFSSLLELSREPAVIFWSFGFPILLSIGLGIAFRTRPPEKTRVAIIASDPARAKVAFDALSQSADLDPLLLDRAEAEEALRKTKVSLLLEVGSSTHAVYRYDPMQPESRTARLATEAALERAAGRRDLYASEDRPVTESGRRYIDFLLPGLLGLNLMGSSMWGVGYAVVEARSRKLMKRFAATPLRRGYYLASFMLSRFFLLVLEVILLMTFGLLAFDIELKGHAIDLGIVAGLGAASFSGVALLIAARPSRTEIASGWMNFVMMPMWLLSGSFFSYERFPEAVHPFIRALPLTALNDALRLVVNEGATLAGVAAQILILAAWGVVGFAVSLRIFRWQ
jgi:ABC-2 type transport system permease protein